MRVCGAGNDGVLKPSPTPLGPSLSVPSIIAELLMIPIHTPAERAGGAGERCVENKKEDRDRGRGEGAGEEDSCEKSEKRQLGLKETHKKTNKNSAVNTSL